MKTDSASLALRYAIKREADLNPPLGYPGGPCQVVERVEETVRRPRTKEVLLRKVEEAKDFSGQEEKAVYDILLERGARDTRFKNIIITPHAQYRMDQRGVTVGDIISGLKHFHKMWADEKNRNSRTYQSLEARIQDSAEIEWETSFGLFMVFTVVKFRGQDSANIITAYWKAGGRPQPVDRSQCIGEAPSSEGTPPTSWSGPWSEFQEPAGWRDENGKKVAAGTLVIPFEPFLREAAPKKYEGINFTPPESVAKAAEKGLEYRRRSGKGGITNEQASKEGIGSGVQRAVNLKNRNTISPKVIKQMNGFFSRHEKNKDIADENKGTPWEDAGYVAWLLWGGDPGRSWAAKVLKQMEAADKKAEESKKKASDSYGLTGENQPTDKSLWKKILSEARSKFKWPSAVGSAWAVRKYNDQGGGWEKKADTSPVPSGYTTFVRDDSKLNLPTDLDRTPEQNLPLPGAATPGGEGRDIPKFEYNTPNNDIDERPRTLPEEGGERGNPVNDHSQDNVVTRRPMTAALRLALIHMAKDPCWKGYEMFGLKKNDEGRLVPNCIPQDEEEGMDKLGYKQRWRPGQRQRRSRGRTRQKRRQYYRRNKMKRRRQSKLWRRKNKNNGALRASNRRRRRQVRTRRGSLNETPCPCCVAYSFRMAGGMDAAPPNQRGGENGQRQRRQRPGEARADHREYISRAPQERIDAKRYYHTKCKPNPNCMRRRKKRREKPEFYERKGPKASKQASVLTVPEIAFGIGPDMELGYVNSISPMTGMVTFQMAGRDLPQLNSLPVEVFMRAAAFLSDEDIDAFFDLVDVEIGDEAYEDLDTEGFRECAAMYGVDPGSEEFKEKCFDLIGETDVDAMSASQVDQVTDTLVLGLISTGTARSETDADEHDETIGEEYDPDLFYGEVEQQKAEKEAAQRVARKYAATKLKWKPVFSHWSGTNKVWKQVAESENHSWELIPTGEHPELGHAHKGKRSFVKVLKDGVVFGKVKRSFKKAQEHVQEWVDEYEGTEWDR